MFYYSQLGKNGRLGNQMFQYATLYALGKAKGVDIGIPANDDLAEEYLGKYSQLSLTKAFPRLSAQRIPEFKNLDRYEEESFKYSPNIFLIIDGCDIHGFFQSPHYFSRYKEAIKEEYTFEKDIQASAMRILNDLKDGEEEKVCAIHIRRTDYVKVSNFHTDLLSTDYYQKAITYISQNYENVRYLIFSDDIRWCKNNIKLGEDMKVSFSICESQIEDMCLMTMCNFHIIANSSFSWWGAWLSNNKLTIAPKRWFGHDGPKEWSTIYEQNWGVI